MLYVRVHSSHASSIKHKLKALRQEKEIIWKKLSHNFIPLSEADYEKEIFNSKIEKSE